MEGRRKFLTLRSRLNLNALAFAGLSPYCHTMSFLVDTDNRYRNVKHELNPGTEGHRLLLSHNVINADAQNLVKSTAEFDAKAKDFEDVLTFWKDHYRDEASPRVIVYSLQHLYTNWTLCLSG